jgi:hypothetical protein
MPQKSDFFKGFDSFKDQHVAALNALQESTKIFHQGVQEINQHVMKTFQETLNGHIETARSVANCKHPKEAMELHRNWLQGTLKSCMESGAKFASSTVKLAKNVSEPLSQHAQQFSKQFSKK